jgi:hypothetical protein
MDLYIGTELSFDFKSVLSAFIFQVSGSLPLSYIAHLFERLFQTYIFSFTIIGLACIFIYVKRVQIALLDRKFLLFGLFIIFSAALPVALSKHHSSWVSFGYPYIPVFMQNLALASIMAALVSNKRIVHAVLFFIIFISSIPNYVLFNELDKKDGPVRLAFDMLRIQDLEFKAKYDITYISVEGDSGMGSASLQDIAKPEFGEIYYTKLEEKIYERGVDTNAILLSNSNYKNSMAVMGRVDVNGHRIESPLYISPSRACIEKIASNTDKIISYTTHRDSVLYAYTDTGFIDLKEKLACRLENNWYDNLVGKLSFK